MINDIAFAVSAGQQFAINRLGSHSNDSEAFPVHHHLFTRSADTPILNFVLSLLRQRVGGSNLTALFACRLAHARIGSSDTTQGSRSLVKLVFRRVFGENLLKAIQHGLLVEMRRMMSSQVPNSFMSSLQVTLHDHACDALAMLVVAVLSD